MAYSVTWDEATPAGSEARSLGDDRIRELKAQIRERLEDALVTSWSADPVAPKHSPGKVGIVYYGTTAQINALTGVTEGSIALDSSLGAFKVYISGSWTIPSIIWDNIWVGGDPDHNHLSTAEGGILTIPKFLTTPVNKVSWTAATDWTDVDISTNTGTDTAKAAYVAVELSLGITAAREYSGMTGLFRKKGSSDATTLPRIKAGAAYDPYTITPTNLCQTGGPLIVECDASEIFQVKLQADAGTPAGIVFKVDLIGYFI